MPTAIDDYRVLIVDDEEPVRAFVDRVLRQRGCVTGVAISGPEALDLIAAQAPFDLLLTDVAMPGMRGDELARRVRQTHPAIKTLYLTAFSDRLFEARAALREDEAFLEKPATVQGLLEAVSLLLVGSLPPPRATRVSIPGARVHVAHTVAALDTLSVTGTRILAAEGLPVGSTWPIKLELERETIRLDGRVVRCEAPQSSVASPGALPAYTVALAFVETARTRRVLRRVCDGPSVTIPRPLMS